MGNCESFTNENLKHQRRVNRKIESELSMGGNTIENKIMLLGPGESGKSTVLKQMRLMHHTGFSNHELIEQKYLVYYNMMQGVSALNKCVTNLNFKLSDKQIEAQEQIQMYLQKYGEKAYILDAHLVPYIKILWRSEAMKDAFQLRSKLKMHQITESVEYFLNDLDRIADVDYVPNPTDLLHTRTPTTGIVTTDFTVKRMKFVVIDVGGQRSERRKWIHFFEDVTAILFVAAISEFDQFLIEDNATNRIDEAVRVLRETTLLPFFNKASFILFLNKIDLFKKKLDTAFIGDHFSDFRCENTYENGVKYFRRKFEKALVKKKPYVHETCAVSDTVQIVINTVIDAIIQENMKDTGMI